MRKSFYVLIVFVGLLGAFGALLLQDSYKSSIEELKTEKIHDASSILNLTVFSVKRFLENTDRYLLYMAQSNQLNKLLPRLIIQNEEGAEELQGEINDLFLEFSLMFPRFAQIRLLDLKGMEVVRVNHGLKREVVSSKNLQNKSRRYYFRESLPLKKGEIYYSDIDDNIEYGMRLDGTKVLRMSTPLYLQDRKVGILIVNLNSETLARYVSPSSGHIWVTMNEKLFLCTSLLSQAAHGEIIRKLSEYPKQPVLEEVTTSQGLTTFVRNQLVTHNKGWDFVYEIEMSSVIQQLNEPIMRLVFIFVYIVLVFVLFALLLFFMEKRVGNTRELEEMVKKKTRDLNQSKEKAEKANLAKSVFLSSMSHELRTPLNSILGFSKRIPRKMEKITGFIEEIKALQGNNQPLSEEVIQKANKLLEKNIPDSLSFLNYINSSGEHLLALINDILDLAKIEAGKMELNIGDVEIDPFLSQTMDTVEPLVKQKDIHLEVKTSHEVEKVKGDALRLRQVIMNLLSNAIKFSDEGSDITLTTEFDQQDKLFCVISLKDNGRGIAEENLPMIFENFHQVDNSGHLSGTGLGLPITKQLVEMMGGTITVESVYGEGSTFTVRIPVA